MLNDSSQFTLSGSFYQSATFTATQTINPKVTTTFSIARVSSVCGAGVGSGSATVQVNPISIRTASVNSNQLCTGSELRVGFAKLEGDFAANNRFRIRLTSADLYSGNEDPSLSYDLDAVLENGLLKATIPATVSAQANYTGSNYSVRVLSTAPATLSDHAGYYVAIRPTPTAEFTTESRTLVRASIWGLNFRGSSRLAPS